MSTNSYIAKRAIFDRLTLIKPALLDKARLVAKTPSEVDNVQVAYAWPGVAESHCVYGGGVTFGHDHEAGVTAGGGDELALETATTTWYVRVALPGGEVADCDERCEAIGEAIGDDLRANPTLAGGQSITRVTSGQGDYAVTDESAISILSYQITVQSYI
jgi:hypothetical protein